MSPNHIFCFHALIKKRPKKHRKNTQKWSPKPWKSSPKWLTNKDSQKAAPKEHQITKNDQTSTKMGSSGGGPRTHFFALFEPRGTPGDPQGPQRSPRSSKEASKGQFGIIFAPNFTLFRPILAQFFWTFWLRFSYVFPQLQANKHTNKQRNTLHIVYSI